MCGPLHTATTKVEFDSNMNIPLDSYDLASLSSAGSFHGTGANVFGFPHRLPNVVTHGGHESVKGGPEPGVGILNVSYDKKCIFSYDYIRCLY